MTQSGPAASYAKLVPPELRELLRGRDLRLERPIWGRRGGRHRSARAGVGHEFRDHRAYVPGDDLRMLDWRAAGRRDGLVLRRTQAELALPVAALIDAGGGMLYGEGAQQKWTVAGALIGALASLAAQQGDRFSFALGRDGVLDAAALKGNAPAAIGRSLATTFLDTRPAGRCTWPELIAAAAPRLARRSLVILASDFWDVSDAANADPDLALGRMISSLSQLRAREHDVVLLQIVHRDELEFPWTDRRVFEFEDLSGSRPTIEGPPAQLRADYLRQIQEHLEALDSAAEREGIHLHRVVTDELLSDALLALLARLAGEPVPTDAPTRPEQARP